MAGIGEDDEVIRARCDLHCLQLYMTKRIKIPAIIFIQSHLLFIISTPNMRFTLSPSVRPPEGRRG